MDIHACIDHLGLNANRYQLDQSPPPHEFIKWDDDNPDPQPTQEELEAAWAEIEDDIAWLPVRDKRDQLLRDSDWTDLPSCPLVNVAEWRTYRHQLRNIPQEYDGPDNVVWPEAPEA